MWYLNDVYYFDVALSDPENYGAPRAADGTVTFNVYEQDVDSSIASGTCTARSALTGEYRGNFSLLAASGFEEGKVYFLRVLATVNTHSGQALEEFKISFPTLDISAKAASNLNVVFDNNNTDTTAKINMLSTVGDPWSMALGAYAAGTAGQLLNSAATAAALTTLAGDVTTIKSKTNLIPTNPTDISNIPTAAAVATAVLAEAIEAGMDLRQSLRLLTSLEAGLVSGGGTSTLSFRNAVADTKVRVTATVDEQADRLTLTYDLS